MVRAAEAYLLHSTSDCEVLFCCKAGHSQAIARRIAHKRLPCGQAQHGASAGAGGVPLRRGSPSVVLVTSYRTSIGARLPLRATQQYLRRAALANARWAGFLRPDRLLGLL